MSRVRLGGAQRSARYWNPNVASSSGSGAANGLALLGAMDLWIDGAQDFTDGATGNLTVQTGQTFTVGHDSSATATDTKVVTAGNLGYFSLQGTTDYENVRAAHRAGICPAGDFEIAMLVRVDSFTTAGTLISKDNVNAFELAAYTSGSVLLGYGGIQVQSDPGLYTTGVLSWMMAQVTVNTGSAYIVNFYKSSETTITDPDQVTWTLHSSHVGGDGSAAPNDSGAQPVCFGWRAAGTGAGTFPCNMRLYQARVTDGLGGPTTLRLDADNADHKTWTDTPGNTFTIGRSFGGIATMWVKPNTGWSAYNPSAGTYNNFVAPSMGRPANGEFTLVYWYVHRQDTALKAMMAFENLGPPGGYVLYRTDTGNITIELYSQGTNTLLSGTTTDQAVVSGDFVIWALRMATDGTVDIRFYNNADAGFTDSTTFAGIAGERYFDFVSTKSYLGIHAGAYYGSDIFGGLASNYDTYLSDTDLDDVATYLRNTYA